MQTFPGSALIDISRQNEGYRIRRADCWYGATKGDGWCAIPFVPALYRGQSQRYAPMLPSIARGLSAVTGNLASHTPSDQAKVIVRLAQSWWFARELDHHPMSRHAADNKLELDRLALAQHYGIPTGYLDLTDDFDVAAFFATCSGSEDHWEPIQNGVGVVYRIDLDTGFSTPFGSLEPLGPQVLPRPTEQCAWVTELPMMHAFDGWPNVGAMLFQQDASVGSYFLEKFNGGAALFPPDPLKTVANKILMCRSVPRELVEGAIESFSEDPLGVDRTQAAALLAEVQSIVELTDYRRLLTDDLVESLMADFRRRAELLAEVKVNWRPVRAVPRDAEPEVQEVATDAAQQGVAADELVGRPPPPSGARS